MTEEDYARIKKAIEEFDEKAKNWTAEQRLEYLFKLGTHNSDGTLTKEYGGDENS